jgi:hypothetical protein
MMAASIEAAWLMRESLDGDIDANQKTRIMAAQDILDRSIGKKSDQAGRDARQPPVAILILPAKEVRQIDLGTIENVSTSGAE